MTGPVSCDCNNAVVGTTRQYNGTASLSLRLCTLAVRIAIFGVPKQTWAKLEQDRQTDRGTDRGTEGQTEGRDGRTGPAGRTQAHAFGLLSKDRVLHAAQLTPILFLRLVALDKAPGGRPPACCPGGPQPSQKLASFCRHMLMSTCQGRKYPSCASCRVSGHLALATADWTPLESE